MQFIHRISENELSDHLNEVGEKPDFTRHAQGGGTREIWDNEMGVGLVRRTFPTGRVLLYVYE